MSSAGGKKATPIEEEDLFGSSSDDSDEGIAGKKKKSWGAQMKKNQKKLMKMLVDYGPPYTKMESGITLLDECALPEPSLYEIHTMLNQRLNPNFKDPEDYSNSALHWCARHAHFRPMKLLRMAKVEINPINEFGHTPLHVLCMMVFPEDKRKRQLKVFNWLLEQGADINIRDKGGYCPLDYAAMNGHEAMVAILLERGAEVLRDNYVLVAQRQQLLHIAVGPISRKLIKERIDAVLIENDVQAELERAEKERLDDVKNLRKRHARLARKRQEALDAKAIAQQEDYEAKKEAMKQKSLEDSMSMIQRERNAGRKRFGAWKKNTAAGGRWNYQMHDSPLDIKPQEKYYGYNANLETMRTLREQNKYEFHNERWKGKTGNDLEIEWSRQKIFDIPELIENNEKAPGKTKDGRKRQELVDSLAIRDENDKELDGEDIGDLLAFVS